MRLVAVTIERFRNIVDPQRIELEADVTGLVGKNESGKTTALKALHRLNPANGSGHQFNLTTEYPRWRLARDRRVEGFPDFDPVLGEFLLSEGDAEALAGHMPATVPEGMVCKAARSYDNELTVWLECELLAAIRAAAATSSVGEEHLTEIEKATSLDEAQALAKDKAKELKPSEALVSKALTNMASALSQYSAFMPDAGYSQTLADALEPLLPKFFYFSSYDVLPGQCDLTKLGEKIAGGATLTDGERTVIALLAHAGETPNDFMDADYDSRKAELQAASSELSQHVFEYWQQNPDLSVKFDTDNIVWDQHPNGGDITHRILKIELRDERHGGVETNFSTRSTGFQWFFSFFAAFSEYQSSTQPIIVLLDEPGTSLHGEAQKDFLRFIFDELGASKQTVYTTHSQFMVDPTKYEKLRGVHDRATRENPNLGVAITPIDLAADRDTVLPVESALGYSISQHLFIGSGQHLAVEGSSDFVYSQRLTEHLVAKGKVGLDPQLAMIPVGGDTNMPAFVALLGRRLRVSALIDGAKTGSKIDRVKAAAKHNGVPEAAIIACSQVAPGLPTNADIEDLFSIEDYLRLYNWAFDASVSPDDLAATDEPILRKLELLRGNKFDHALPAHALTEHRVEFFESVTPKTVEQFEALFTALNATIYSVLRRPGA